MGMVSGSVVAVKTSCECSVTEANGCGSLFCKTSGCKRCWGSFIEEGGEKVDRNDIVALCVKRSGARIIRPDLVVASPLVGTGLFPTSSALTSSGVASLFGGSVFSHGWMKLEGKLGISFDGSLRCCSGRKD